MRKSFVFIALLSLAPAHLITSERAAGSVIADLKGDWSNNANPNTKPAGTWGYTQSGISLAFVSPWAGDPSSNLSGWGPAANVPGDFLPFMFKTQIVYGDAQPGDVIVHSTDGFNGAGNGDALILWTTANNVAVDVSLTAWPTRLIGRQNDFSLTLRHGASATTLLGGALPEDGSISRANPVTAHAAHVILAAGDRLELAIVRDSGAGDFAGVNLTIFPACPGDLNGDRLRDLSDLAIMLSQYGCISGCTADLDGDGDVDLSDLAIELSGFGVPCP